MENGNHKISVLNWNKGNAKLSNKINLLQNVISRYKPQVIALQEVNFTQLQTLNEIQVPGYNWELDQLYQQYGRARSALLISKSLRYVRRRDLETPNVVHVWVTLHLQGNKKINIQSYYRQWQNMGVNQKIPGTDSIASQKERLQSVATKWKEALEEGETYSFSDTNLNLRNIGLQPNQLDNHD